MYSNVKKKKQFIFHRNCSVKVTKYFHKINYPEEYSTSNDISYQALGPLFS